MKERLEWLMMEWVLPLGGIALIAWIISMFI